MTEKTKKEITNNKQQSTKKVLYLPTPHVGMPIQWFDKAIRSSQPVAGVVTAIEDPGRVSVLLFEPRSVPRHVLGVWHMSAPVHEAKNNVQSQKYGGWDFLPHATYFEESLAPHVEKVARKEALRAKDEQRLKEAAEKKQREEEIKKRMQEDAIAQMRAKEQPKQREEEIKKRMQEDAIAQMRAKEQPKQPQAE